MHAYDSTDMADDYVPRSSQRRAASFDSDGGIDVSEDKLARCRGRYGCLIVLESSLSKRLWDVLVVLCVCYSTAYLPLALVFVQARWSGHRALDGLIDAVLIIDVILRFCTTYVDRGYVVADPRRVATHYLRTWFALDLLSSLPFSAIAAATEGSPAIRDDVGVISVAVHPLQWLGLLRVLAVGRCVRAASWMLSAHVVRRQTLLATVLKVSSLLFTFVLMAHYLGLGWYMLAIRPLEADGRYDDAADWVWLSPDGPTGGASVGLDEATDALRTSPQYVTSLRYVCSLYWALALMSNLKGHAAHETRQCFTHTHLIVDPLAERVYTLCAFILGACMFAFIYGNIAQFVTTFYSPGEVREQRMADADAIASFYQITPELQGRLRRHVEFSWSVTKGIDLDVMAGGLPRHLKLEVQLQVNLPMLRKVSFLQRLDEPLMEELIAKLSLLPVVAHEYVFYEGQPATRMFFIYRGLAHVVKANAHVATLKDGDYFGELALLVGSSTRTSDVVAASDVILQALSVIDFNAVMARHPEAKAQVEAVAEERRRQLLRVGTQARLQGQKPGNVKRKSPVSPGNGRRGRRASVDTVEPASLVAAPVVAPPAQQLATQQARRPSISEMLMRQRRPSVETALGGGRQVQRKLSLQMQQQLPPGACLWQERPAGARNSVSHDHAWHAANREPQAGATHSAALESKVDTLSSQLSELMAVMRVQRASGDDDAKGEQALAA